MGDGPDPRGPRGAARLTGPSRPDRPPPLEQGTIVTLREVWRGHTVAARPVRVVEDAPGRHQAFYLAPGSRWLDDPADHGEVRFLDGPWELEPRTSERPVLSFAFPDAEYAVLLTWTRSWDFLGYYVNIQSPLQAGDGALEYSDWFLDVRLPPALDRHQWKDEAELEEAARRGLMSAAETEAARRAGTHAIDRLTRRAPPFDREWSGWRPDPSWGPLDLPDGSS